MIAERESPARFTVRSWHPSLPGDHSKEIVGADPSSEPASLSNELDADSKAFAKFGIHLAIQIRVMLNKNDARQIVSVFTLCQP
jgi:hypothetical protein